MVAFVVEVFEVEAGIVVQRYYFLDHILAPAKREVIVHSEG